LVYRILKIFISSNILIELLWSAVLHGRAWTHVCGKLHNDLHMVMSGTSPWSSFLLLPVHTSWVTRQSILKKGMVHPTGDGNSRK
jgi:hypothetical protein